MNVLITYAYAGIGHKKAAQAIHHLLQEFKDIEVNTVDILDYTNVILRFLYPRIYLFLINRLPTVWGFFYYFFDLRVIDKFFAPLRIRFNFIQAKNFIRFILEKKPDLVLCTHFFPAEVISELKRKEMFSGKLVTVITDFLPHAFWLAKGSDYFIVAMEQTKAGLTLRGIQKGRIKVLGIPCGPEFNLSRDKNLLIKKIGLKSGYFTILIMSGGFGTGPIRKIICAIAHMEEEIKNRLQIIVICGKNKGLFNKLNGVKLKIDVDLKIFGFVHNVDEFMEVSDCIITKSGGLTVSEALSKKLPMIIIRPIPGQETENCNLLTGYGAAVQASTVKDAIFCIRQFIKYPEKLIAIKKRIDIIAYADAARKIAEFVTSVGVGRDV